MAFDLARAHARHSLRLVRNPSDLDLQLDGLGFIAALVGEAVARGAVVVAFNDVASFSTATARYVVAGADVVRVARDGLSRLSHARSLFDVVVGAPVALAHVVGCDVVISMSSAVEAVFQKATQIQKRQSS